eukprot:366522-Chlamydomonas_euryale.AAC.18
MRLIPKLVSTADSVDVSSTLPGLRPSISTPAACNSTRAREMSNDKRSAVVMSSLPSGCWAMRAARLVG